MADHHDHCPVAYVSPFDGETNIQNSWNDDIKRAAFAAANGNYADAQDYAQEARLRLMNANRSMPDASEPYIRVVISNSMKSARRSNACRFSTASPMADPVDDLPAAATDDIENRISAVTVWTMGLPAPLERIYRLLYVEERSQRETAALMKISQPRVAQLHRRLIELGRTQLVELAA